MTFKPKLNSIKTFNLWSIFYCFILLLSLIYNTLFVDSNYPISDFFINYHGGFIRRGLLGECLLYLYGYGISPFLIIYTLCISSFLIIAIFMVYNFHKRGYALGILTTSFMLGGVGLFGFAFFRRDFILLSIFLLIIYLRKRISFPFWLLFGNILSIIAILCHEPYVFWALPFLICITHLRQKNWLISSLLWLPSLLAFILCIHFSGNLEQYLAIRRATESFIEYPNVIDFLHFKTDSVMKWHISSIFLDRVHHIPNIIGSMISISVAIYISTTAVPVYNNTLKREDRTNYSLLFMLAITCLLPMFTILSIDYSRTCMYAAISAYIVFFMLTEEECRLLFPPKIYQCGTFLLNKMDTLIPPSRTKVLLIILLIGTVETTDQSTLGLFRDSEIGNTLVCIYKTIMLIWH